VVLPAVPDPPASVDTESAADTEPVAVPESPRDEHHDKAEALLTGLRRTDSRLMLSRGDVRRLIPAVAAWFRNGVGRADVLYALTSEIPPTLKHPAGFLAYRLRELLPPPLPPLPEPVAVLSALAEPTPSYGFVDCVGWCDRVFRAAGPGYCRDCRKLAEAMSLPPLVHQPDAASTQHPHPHAGPRRDGSPGARALPTRKKVPSHAGEERRVQPSRAAP
jgi:hypothetical protein